jgi:ubiquinone/menaquinone biosynthesis C-methylase UbiE
MARADYWNHNVHYQPVILGAVPPGCGPALDVGCGDGMLACRLTERCAQVTGIDRDPRMIALARARARADARQASRPTCSTGPCTAGANPVRPSWIPR